MAHASDTLVLYNVILPITINIACGIFIMILPKRWRWMTLITATAALFIILGSTYNRTKLVIVPDLHHQWYHRALILCEELGLRPDIVISPYTRVERRQEGYWSKVSHLVRKYSEGPGLF